MKVKCKENRGYGSLEIGKVYDILYEDSSGYSILLSKTIKAFCPKHLFEDIKDTKEVQDMKVKCIRSTGYRFLMVGKTYDVISESSDDYRIQQFKEGSTWYPKSYFEVIKEEVTVTTQERLDEIRKEHEELTKKIVELEEQLHKENEKKKWWTPEDRDEYYYTTNYGEVLSTYYSTDDSLDSKKIKTLNCFQTRKKAEREAFEILLRRELKKFAFENNEGEIDWNDLNMSKYTILYNHNYKINHADELLIDDWTFRQHCGVVYFTSEDIAQKALEKFKDKLIRYYTTNE